MVQFAGSGKSTYGESTWHQYSAPVPVAGSVAAMRSLSLLRRFSFARLEGSVVI